MTGESEAKQRQYLLLVFLQSKILSLGLGPESPCINLCAKRGISVIKTLLFSHHTDCFRSVFGGKGRCVLAGGEEGE